jgi:hypothetical protein
MKRIRSSFFIIAAVFGLVAGCNAILDNTPATLAPVPVADEAGTIPAEGTERPSSPVGEDPAIPDAGAPQRADGGACAPGQHLCHGLCVQNDDPLYGCGAASCTPCVVKNGSARCEGNACAVASCDKGYFDCDGNAKNGCEGDLSKPASCGACNAKCAAAAPVCAPAGPSFQCGTGCTADAPLLCGGTQCVNPTTAVNHCGGCNNKCPVVDNGTTTCAAGRCGFDCRAGYHKCGAQCAVATDPKACGGACVVCPEPPHAAATCQADRCGFTCSAGFADCNRVAADGCEAALATDPANCGGCGIACASGGACVNGVCAAPPPPDGGADGG